MLDGDVLGTFGVGQCHADEGNPRAGAHAVGDRLLEAVAVADPAEVGEQQLDHRVVAAFEGRGEPEPFVVLGEQGTAQRAPAEAVTLVGDEEPARGTGRNRLVRRRRMPGGDQHVTSSRDVGAAVAEPSDPVPGQGGRQPDVPLLHKDPRGNDDQYEAAAPQRVGSRSDGNVGLARPCDRLDDAAPAAAQPAHERVELPAVELAIGRHGTTTVPARPGHQVPARLPS